MIEGLSVVDDEISCRNLLIVLDVLRVEFLVDIPAIQAHWGHYQKVSPMELNSDVLVLLGNWYFQESVALSIVSQQVGLSWLLLNLKQLAIVEKHENGASVGVHRRQLYTMSLAFLSLIRKVWIFLDPEGRGIGIILVLQIIYDMDSKAFVCYLFSCVIGINFHICIVNVNLWISDKVCIGLR